MKSILDRSFRYTPSHETDLRKRFAKERRRIAEQQQQAEQPTADVITPQRWALMKGVK